MNWLANHVFFTTPAEKNVLKQIGQRANGGWAVVDVMTSASNFMQRMKADYSALLWVLWDDKVNFDSFIRRITDT